MRWKEDAEPRQICFFLSTRPVTLCTVKKFLQEKEERSKDEVVSEEAGGEGLWQC